MFCSYFKYNVQKQPPGGVLKRRCSENTQQIFLRTPLGGCFWMLYITKIDDYLKILTDEEVKDFVAIDFSEYFKSRREKQNLRKVAKSLYFILTTPGKVEKYVQSTSSGNCIHNYNVEILDIFDPDWFWLALNQWLKTN